MNMENKKPAPVAADFKAVHFKEAEIRDAVASTDKSALFLQRNRHLVKHGNLFAMLDSYGDIGALIHNDTSYHASRLLINGVLRDGTASDGAALVQRESRYDDASKTWHFACDNQPFLQSDGTPVAASALAIASKLFIWSDAAYRRVELSNRSDAALTLTLTFAFENRMVDMFDLRGDAQRQWGSYRPARFDRNTVLSVYEARDGIRQASRLRFSPHPARLDDRHAQYEVTLAAGESKSFVMEAHAFEAENDSIPLAANHRDAARMFDQATAGLAQDIAQAQNAQATLVTNNDELNRILERSAYDMAMLVTMTAEGAFPMAGMPWYNAVFGRDSLIAAKLELWRNPELAKGVLLHLAANQATTVDKSAAAQPGKIPHEIRLCEMARTGQVPYRRYYGSVDAPMLFVMLADDYLSRTGDIGTLHKLWPHILAVLEWMRAYGDPDRSGLIKYARATKEDLANQGWEDSGDSVHHADGALASGAVALVEVQGYAFAALRGAARLARLLGQGSEASRMEGEANDLRARIDALYWDNDIGSYGMAIDARGLCRTLDSNIGHLLLTGTVTDQRAGRVAELLRSDDFFTGWGVRTKPASASRYDPNSYHNGSIWPHSNALIALGLKDYGYAEDVARILKGLIGAARHFNDRCPELFSGATRQGGDAPEPYKNANPVQAWSAAAIPGMVAALLGLRIDTDQKIAFFERPYLPEYFGGEVILQRLQVGTGSVNLRLEGRDYDVRLTITGQSDGATATINP